MKLKRVREVVTGRDVRPEEPAAPAAQTRGGKTMKRTTITWPKAAEETGITIRQLRAYGETPEEALGAYWEAAEVAAEGEITDEMAEEVGFTDAAELIEAAESEGLDPLAFYNEFKATAKPARKVEARKAAPARREAQPQRGKPAATRRPATKRDEAADEIARLKARITKAKKEGKRRLAAALQEELDELQTGAERMPYPDAGKVVGDGEEAVADYALFSSGDIVDYAQLRWQQKFGDEREPMPDRLRATVAFTNDQTLTITVRKDGIGETPGRERGEAIAGALAEGFYAIDFPAENNHGGLFLDCNVEVSSGRVFEFDEEGRLVWGSKSRTQFFRHGRGPADQGKAKREAEEPSAQAFRRGKARR